MGIYCKELDEGDIEILEAMIPSVPEFFPLHLPLHFQSSTLPMQHTLIMCWAGKLSAGSGAGLALLTVLPPAAVQVLQSTIDRVRVRVTSLVVRLDIKLHVPFWSKALGGALGAC